MVTVEYARRAKVCRYCGCPINQATHVERWWDDGADDADRHVSTANGEEYAHTECAEQNRGKRV